jgi:hypothetical protein
MEKKSKFFTHEWLRLEEQFVVNSVGVFEITIHEGVNNNNKKKVEVLVKKSTLTVVMAV